MQNVLDKYFYPKSLCIVGASAKPGSIGYELTRSVKEYGFTGQLLLVNPKADELLGYKCYPSVKEIDSTIDLAIILVPKKFVEQSITNLVNKNVKAIILVTAGFKETGKEGAEEEKHILEIVNNAGARLVGPNCMGIINTDNNIKMNATFVAEKPQNGKMAFCSQSGAIGAAVLNTLRETDIRFSHFISVGNKADITENDLLEYWQQDDNISVITYYLESFEDGEKFILYFIDEKVTKPVVVVKGGRTASGIKAASSHTGALGSSDKVVDAIMDQFGIIRADDLNDLFNIAKGFENFPTPEGNRIAVVTNAGGPSILTVDSLEKNGLALAELSEDTKSKLREFAPPQGSVNNPVDLLPGGTAEQFKKANELLAADKNVDAVISVFVEPIMVKALPVIEAINEINSDVPIFQVVMPLPEFWDEYRKESKTKKPLFRNPENPAVIIAGMLKFKNRQTGDDRVKQDFPASFDFSFDNNKDHFLQQDAVNMFAEYYNFPMINNKLVNIDEINQVDVAFPIVLKAIGEKIIHKSELEGVVLNIGNKDELVTQANKMIKNFREQNIQLDSFLIQPYIHTKFELLIGGFRDPSFGPMVMFGTGGKYVEFYDDTIIRSAYLTDRDVDGMIEGTKIGKIIKGVRGEQPVNIDAVKSTIKSVAQMMVNHKEITECDLNPLIVTDNNELFAVDVRIKC
ncbi:succinyl-CoA ligase [ADP-forming] subunit alpha [bacterium BMS3Abin03]|nr:succinyl-CoA ligase [ADP-forming] subunit alpha [bacterium BMS3Abin03]